ncbi:tRNA 4-thiouridine(8) synthase ThiI [Nocardia sp. CDC159]|uniref:Probable tRNA sulfurtransferase n=1 Tax=Nocardia pulmonis TaxID=2951408 RepID=A0A9X2ECW5_9NOCA|nr:MULTISPECIES: tRNA uracil 4-sulfurtransferase ThiI [Nocardia]MCM6778070.1 tRNA 4-thiouridine(8) synthase ThiI [Nocardia pulmonis]MCM6790959.1 tRNA 4-thiouridine(8) synthase ThiI [Nocardia sp. CDC159]
MDPATCVLAKFGEITLKGRNQRWFENTLIRNMRRALGGRRIDIRRRGGFLIVSAPHLGPEELTRRLQQVMGLSVVQPAVRVPFTPEAAAEAAIDLLRDHKEQSPTFAVRVRRRGKTFPLTSDQLAAYIGARVCREFGWTVDLRNPQLPVVVEVDPTEIFVSVDRLPGQGGLPVGCTGRALVLLSGGYDSPVAAYRSMRRGLQCDYVHFTGAPYTDPASTYKAYALAFQLARYQPRARLHVVPIGRAQKALATAGSGPLQTVAHRRLYLRVAERLARRHNNQVLVTGDSLGQVASQTLANLVATDDAAELPVLRPLIGWDKQEIIAEARRIGTCDISTLPDEDCCRLFTPPEVSTRATPAELVEVEARADVDALVAESLAQSYSIVVAPGTGQRSPTEALGLIG